MPQLAQVTSDSTPDVNIEFLVVQNGEVVQVPMSSLDFGNTGTPGNFTPPIVENIASMPYTTLNKTNLAHLNWFKWNGLGQDIPVGAVAPHFTVTLNANGSVTLTAVGSVPTGTGQLSYWSLGTLSAPEEPTVVQLNAPTNLVATADGSTIINLTWTDTNS